MSQSQRILVIGGRGTIGEHLVPALLDRGHEVIVAGRSDGDVLVDITDSSSLARMYDTTPGLDGVVVIAASGALDKFTDLTIDELMANARGKLFGQTDAVLTGQRFLNDGGSFTLTSGIFADEAWPGVTGGALVSGGIHSFVLSAAIELPRGLRINVVSPTMVADSADAYSDGFPGMRPIPMATLVAHYLDCIEGSKTGQIVRAYG